MESPFRKRGRALRPWFSGGAALVVGLGDLTGFFQLLGFCDSDLLSLHILVSAVCVTPLTEGRAEQCTEHGLVVSCSPFAEIRCLI